MESEHLNTLRQETDQQMRAIHALKDQIQQDLAKNLSKGVELDQEIKHTINGISELQHQRTTTHNDLRLLQQLAHQFSSTQAQTPQPEKTTERTLT